jgi:glycosyltransferase involved in cell wall biosynthesis
MPACVIVVENLPVPLDRRVWQEATALRDAGWTVSVICPATAKYPKRLEIIEDIMIFRHPLPAEGRGILGFIIEYAVALFYEFRLLFTVHRKVGFDIIQACNPPDFILVAALPWKLVGKKLVFDQHDICPELMAFKFGDHWLLQTAVLLAEKFAFTVADLVISANESFRQLAISRGGKRAEEVVSVYSVPDRRFFQRTKPLELSNSPHGSERIIIGYVGIIGDQDGVDNIVLMVKHLVSVYNLRDFSCVIVGDGPALPGVKALAEKLDIAQHFKFTGFLSGNELLDALSGFHIGIIPDPVNPCNDKMTMNKVFEYAAMSLPIVAFELSETRRLLGESALFARQDDPAALADEVARLIADPDLRRELGQRAKVLADSTFNWSYEAGKYVSAMTALCPSSESEAVRGTEQSGRAENTRHVENPKRIP